MDGVARILRNENGEDAATVRRRLAGLIAAMTRHGLTGRHRAALQHFLTVTKSYWPGLFATYDVEGLPRTNNDLEHLFGSCRYHERRASGRRRGSEGLIVRGQVRLVAAVATRLAGTTPADLRPPDLAAWRSLRVILQQRRHPRVLGRRFRRDSDAYLRALEKEFFRAILPA